VKRFYLPFLMVLAIVGCSSPTNSTSTGGAAVGFIYYLTAGETAYLTNELFVSAGIPTSDYPTEVVHMVSGATVTIDNVSAKTDSIGRFNIQNISPGSYLVHITGGPVPQAPLANEVVAVIVSGETTNSFIPTSMDGNWQN